MPDDINNIYDLKKIPIIDKEIIRLNIKSFLAKNLKPSSFILLYTGGSTGEPLSLYYERGRTWAYERAFMNRQFNWVGYRYGHDKTVVLRGNVPRNGWFDYDPAKKALVLSSYLLTKDNALEYLKKIKEYQPVSISAYPSVITLLANYLDGKAKVSIPTLKVILCGSEEIRPNQRELIEKVFGCRVYSWYGQSECVCLAGECEINNKYHIYSEYGITELLDKDGNEVNKPGQVGEIVATGFNNYAMPFIRYKIGDLAIKSDEKCNCGRNYTLLEKIQGRSQEIVINKDGNQIALNPIVFGIHGDIWRQIRTIQFIQNEQGILEVLVVKAFSASDQKLSRNLEDMLIDRSGNRIQFNIRFVEQLQRTRIGKAPLLIQRLNT